MTALISLLVSHAVVVPISPLKKVYTNKGYFGKYYRDFLNLNQIANGIMTKATRGTELTQYEIERNIAISKVRYVVEQYFRISTAMPFGPGSRG
jgi:IS5 family transposase